MSVTLKVVNRYDLKLLSDKDIVRFALFCAEQVRDEWKDIPECVVAIETVERWLEGKVTEEECIRITRDVACITNGITNAVYYAIRITHAEYYSIAPFAAYAADRAVYSHKPKLIEAQWNYYNELLHFDDIAEKALLEESV